MTHEQPLITRIPTADEAAMLSTAIPGVAQADGGIPDPVVDPSLAEYQELFDPTIRQRLAGNKDYYVECMQGLRADFSQPIDRYASTRYGKVRSSAIIAITEMLAEDPAISDDLLETVINTMYKSTVEVNEDINSAGQAQAMHMRVKHSAIEKSSEAVDSFFDSLGITQIHEVDSTVIAASIIASHEAGHIISYAVDKDTQERGSDYSVAYVYLAAHPEEAFTGNWTTDAWIMEERFAEGVSHAVTEKLIINLGYTEQQAVQIINCLVSARRSDDIASADGKQLQLLSHITPDMTMEDAVRVHGDLETMSMNGGLLGYASPLSKSELLSVMKLTDDVRVSKNSSLYDAFIEYESHPQKWGEIVRNAQHRDGQRVLPKTLLDRLEVLAAHEKTLRKQEAKQKRPAARIKSLGAALVKKVSRA